MVSKRLLAGAIFCVILCCVVSGAQMQGASSATASLRLQLVSEGTSRRPIHAVVWLDPVGATPRPELPAARRYTLMQKNRMFSPHLMVVPVGAVVDFPNADPFFHNVFSLFDGKRFDLGLYEAGSSKTVTFSREGVSYIFCNIHPEMSAVVVALRTPYYVIADAHGVVEFPELPAGSYRLHYWVEGMLQDELNQMTRNLQLDHDMNLGSVKIPDPGPTQHLNKFGKPYGKAEESPY